MNTQTEPLFSIILPTYNRVALLHHSVQSVLSQTFQNWELIIVDDGSEDETQAYISALTDKRVRYIFQKNSERSTARNAGILAATGKYLCFLDDDDQYQPDYLAKFYDYYSKNGFPEIILRTGFCRNDRGKLKPAPNYNPKKHLNSVRFAAFHMCGVWTLSIPKGFLKNDTFHPDFPHWQDTHLILRLFARYGMNQIEEYTYIYNIHDSMGSKKMVNQIEQKLALNILPIDHLFENYNDLLKPYLPSYTRRYLIAKKYLEFAHYDIVYGDKTYFKKFIKTSLEYHLSFKFLKTYLILIRDIIKHS